MLNVKKTEFSYNLFLNASHKCEDGVHSNTWNINIVINASGLSVTVEELYSRLEKALEYYQNKNLNEAVPFDVLNPDLVNISRYFAERFGAVAASCGCSLTEIRVNDSVRMGIVVKMADE